MKRRTFLLTGALAWVGCRDEKERAPATARQPVEVYSWGGLQNELLEEHERRHPTDEVIHANPQLSGVAHRALGARLASGDPPDSFQANAGKDLLRWVVFNGADARESKLEPVDDLLPANHPFPDVLLRAIRHGGKTYAVPANVHQLNRAFYNPAILERVHRQPPSNVRELLGLGHALQRRGIPLLALGTRDPWPLSLLFFEALLTSLHGADFYEAYFTGNESPTHDKIRDTLEVGLALLRHSNSDRASLHWDQAAEKVYEGQAAMTVMGDWASTLFDSRPDAQAKYLPMAFPATAETVVFTCNVFTLPRGAKNREGARRLLRTVVSREGQAALAASRTSLPSRLDVDVNPGNKVQATKQLAWRGGKRLVLAQSGMTPPSFAKDVSSALAELDEQQRISPALYTLRARYPLLGSF